MNVVVGLPDEVSGGKLVVSGVRATHLYDVVGVRPGAQLKATLAGKVPKKCQVIAASRTEVIVDAASLVAAADAAPLGRWLILAMPRPKVLRRCLEVVGCLGLDAIHVTNSWRVDKSYLQSAMLSSASLTAALRDGCEQGGHGRLPVACVYERFVHMREAVREYRGAKVVLHPHCTQPLSLLASQAYQSSSGEPLGLAIGPEGGFIERELQTFSDLGFAAASLSMPILRVEHALVAAFAQLAAYEDNTAVAPL